MEVYRKYSYYIVTTWYGSVKEKPDYHFVLNIVLKYSTKVLCLLYNYILNFFTHKITSTNRILKCLLL